MGTRARNCARFLYTIVQALRGVRVENHDTDTRNVVRWTLWTHLFFLASAAPAVQMNEKKVASCACRDWHWWTCTGVGVYAEGNNGGVWMALTMEAKAETRLAIGMVQTRLTLLSSRAWVRVDMVVWTKTMKIELRWRLRGTRRHRIGRTIARRMDESGRENRARGVRIVTLVVISGVQYAVRVAEGCVVEAIILCARCSTPWMNTAHLCQHRPGEKRQLLSVRL